MPQAQRLSSQFRKHWIQQLECIAQSHICHAVVMAQTVWDCNGNYDHSHYICSLWTEAWLFKPTAGEGFKTVDSGKEDFGVVLVFTSDLWKKDLSLFSDSIVVIFQVKP